MHTSSLSNQIRLARAIGVPASKIDRFVAHTRKKPIHTIVDLHRILDSMKLDKAQMNAIANKYLAHVVGPVSSIRTGNTVRSGSNKKRRASNVSNTASSSIRNIVKNRPPQKKKPRVTNNNKKTPTLKMNPNASKVLLPLARNKTSTNGVIRSIINSPQARLRLKNKIPEIPINFTSNKRKEEVVQNLKVYASTGVYPSRKLKIEFSIVNTMKKLAAKKNSRNATFYAMLSNLNALTKRGIEYRVPKNITNKARIMYRNLITKKK